MRAKYDPRNKPYAAQLTQALAIMRQGDFYSALAICAAIEQRYGETPWTQQLAMLITKDRLGDKATALEASQAIIEKWPGWSDAQYNHGAFLQEQGRWEEALRPLRKALSLEPDHHAARCQLGIAYTALGDDARAKLIWDDVLRTPPANPREAYQRGCIYASRNDFATFWDLQELRWVAQDHYNHDHGPMPGVALHGEHWTGDDLTGHSLLVLDEQGAGDVIQFARYLPVVAARAEQVWLRLKNQSLAPLIRLIAPMVHILGHLDPQPLCSRFVGLMSLYHRLVLRGKPPLEPAFPQHYVDIPPLDIHAERPRVGLCWAGSPSHPRDAQRSIPFETITPLIEAVDAVDWINCCWDPRGDVEHSQLQARPDVASYLDTARVLKSLDLLITVDTSIAHLAGAMGVKTWVLVTTLPDMRWGLMNDTTPWYRSWTFLRQKEPNNWERLIAALPLYRDLYTWTSASASTVAS